MPSPIRRPHLFLALLLAAAPLFSARLQAAPDRPLQAVANEAIDAFNKSEWPRAIADYKELAARGVGDAGVYYNLGTAYAKAGDKGRAVLNLELARRLDPRDPDTAANLALIDSQHTANVAAVPIPPLDLLLQQISLNGWARLAQLLTLLALGTYGAMFSRRRTSPWRARLKGIASTAALCALFAHGCSYIKYENEVGTLRGVVVGAEAKPAVSPDPAASTLDFTLPPGSVITLRRAGVKGWVKANYAGRVEFFLPDSAVELLHF